MSSVPQAPAFGLLRLASLRDVSRIGVVATAGFRYSPVFVWGRMYHDKFPEDTCASYCDLFTKFILDPEYIVLVAEDEYDPDEQTKTLAKLPENDQVGDHPAKVVVGVGCWKLEDVSQRKGHFQLLEDEAIQPKTEKCQDRDLNPKNMEKFHKALSAAERKYFVGHSVLERLVVHPAYWRRGHGRSLVRWGNKLADTDQVNLGVIASSMGERLYLELGAKKQADVRVEGDAEMPKDIVHAILRYEPCSLSISSSLKRGD